MKLVGCASSLTTHIFNLKNIIMTTELVKIDPVEYGLDGMSQIPVYSRQGDSFANKLRAVLRLDPDVIMVGEIRDVDTARTALQASITGHLVLSTFHAGSASEAFTRMIDMIGQNPILISAIKLIISQRLVRRLDSSTKIAYEPDAAIKKHIQDALKDLPPDIKKPDLEKITLYKPGKSEENPSFKKIAEKSAIIMESMSDIVWSINPANDEMSKITIFKTAFDSENPNLIEIDVALERIRTGKASKAIIEQLETETDEKERANLKKKLPLICFSGEFTKRANKAVTQHSGYICLDFDKLGDRLETVRSKFQADKYTMACFLSPKRNGLKVIVKIPKDIDNHEGYFEGLRLHFKEKSLDDDSEIARGCFESYDPNIYINKNSAVFDILVQPRVDVAIDYSTRKNKIKDPEIIYDKIKKWAEKHFVYEDGNKYRFLVAIASACNRFGIEQEMAEQKLIQDFQSKASFVEADDFRDIVNRIYISYNNQFDISWLTDKGELNDFNPTGPARDVIYLNDIRQDMLKSFKEGFSKGETTYFKSIDEHWTWKRGELTLMGGIPNHGKCLSINTLIPTIDGWKELKDIKIGDKIFDEKGKVCNVLFATEPMFNHNCYEIKFNDGSTVVADDEHLWFTETDTGRQNILSSPGQFC